MLIVERLPHGADLPLPAYETAGAAGMDIRAAMGADMVLRAGARAAIPTGLKMAVPLGFECQIRPRSGLALHHGLTCLNTPGTVDSDYRGEVKVILINHSSEDFTITHGMRIAQMVIAPVTQMAITEAPVTDETARNAGGFGSTGLK